ncbi:uncharacterized protein CANTADRAFT_89523 [Suhomyces tanzawaensis NRRL Y-17324]|uniref:Exonuclease V, mitochondrial n=1 Tax=Suhomyces tanzawaensis NRRL Y-17324 TaxID=984487 RepID=A0A1E4SK76_9ASCO|nr:uncharacterized protein CANTADRAFT_89523 [Suhomyces tanzawaensis NRRL Y-17324]ODV79911.1 hypothetical protein CANTADRAFT_89523 [Suhomyces tanzawaensis NRRL Y-17324]
MSFSSPFLLDLHRSMSTVFLQRRLTSKAGSNGSSVAHNDTLTALYHNWSLPPTQTLPLQSPLRDSPYQFHSKTNSDPSYIQTPRLAVTKMLVDRWCELREYYGIYSGSLSVKPSKAIELGVERHLELEEMMHTKVDVSSLEQTVEEIYTEVVRREELICTEEQGDLVFPDPPCLERLSVSVEEFEDAVFGSVGVSDMASQWSNQIINRLYALITTSEAREVLVHCYVDLTKGKFIDNTRSLLAGQTDPGVANPRKVLVSGIIDHLSLTNQHDPSDLSLFEEIKWNEEYNCDHVINHTLLVDITSFLKRTEKLLGDHKDSFKVRTTDVKTRSYNKIPPQKSVLESAKFQTIYYRKMFGLLATENRVDEHFGYNSLLENARQRGLNVDEPINMLTILVLLRQNFKILYKDFVKLAKGEPIGHEAYDTFMRENSFDSYDLSQLVQLEPFENLSLAENFDYCELLTSDLITAWKYPPTLRYFAARSAQFYSLFQDLMGDVTSVEYHNVKTQRCFHTSEYAYNSSELESQLQSGTSFWNGERAPIFTNDLDKCKYCEFNSRCAVPNGKTDDSDHRKIIGQEISRFLEDRNRIEQSETS